MILAGNVALESMVSKLRFAGGREDTWNRNRMLLGSEDKWLGDKRYSGRRELENRSLLSRWA